MASAIPTHSTLDADLRLLCLEFHALRAIETAPVHASDGIDVEAFFSARVRRRAVTGQILAIRPSTAGERQALARVVVTLVDDGEFPIHAAPTACIRG